MARGLIVRGHGGLYYVYVQGRTIQCRARGAIKKTLGDLLVGDIVIYEDLPDGEGVITDIVTRRNKLVRPAMANIDVVVTVFSLHSPDPIALLIDKFLVVVEASGFQPLLVFTKCDLLPNADERFSYLPNDYRRAGYDVFITSSVTCLGIPELREALNGRMSVVAGPSGVGKSALLNKLQDSISLKTGDISSKIRRGKHTTRHASLIQLDGGGWVADTPGFSTLDLFIVPKQDLQRYFHDFDQYLGGCRFSGCMHRAEPDCAVKAAVASGEINKVRYDNYIALLAEIETLPPDWARRGDID